MQELATVGVMTAFVAGIVSFLSPCVLPIVPGYLSFVAGEGYHRGQRHMSVANRFAMLGMSGLFVAGFSVVFIGFGASASVLGQLLMRYRYEANLVAGVIVTLFGLFMLGAWRWIPWLQRDLRVHPRLQGGSPIAAFVLGVAFAFGWTPCIGPVLGAILAVSATTNDGVGLLTAYALGLGVPFLVAAAFVDRASNLVRRLRGFGAALQIAGGLIMVVLGVAMFTGQLSRFSLWLLDAVPVLGKLG